MWRGQMFYAIVISNAVIAAFALWFAVDYFVRPKEQAGR